MFVKYLIILTELCFSRRLNLKIYRTIFYITIPKLVKKRKNLNYKYYKPFTNHLAIFDQES